MGISKVSNWFKSLDLYGQTFDLNYRGEETYKTLHGACFSIFIGIIVLNYTANNVIRMTTRSDPTVFVHSEPIPFDSKRLLDINFEEFHFNVGVQIMRHHKHIKIDEEIATVQAF
jgi:hypothetical protein